MIISTKTGIYDFSKIGQKKYKYKYSIDEISEALGNQCRFNGQCNRFYSVASHSILVSKLYEKDPLVSLYGLMHDFHEAYTGDIITPIQSFLKIPSLKKLQNKIDKDIRLFYKISEPNDFQRRIVKKCDVLAFIIEYHNLFRPSLLEEVVKTCKFEKLSEYGYYLKRKDFLDSIFREQIDSNYYYSDIDKLISRFENLLEKVN